MKNIIIAILILSMSSCNPLRRVQRTEKTDSLTIDKSIISKSEKTILTGESNFVQTVIEFYPPSQLTDRSVPETPNEKQPTEEILSETLSISHPPIKRIIRTEVSQNTEISDTKDSVAHRDLQTGVVSELSEKVVEKPPPSVISLRWIVIGIGCLLALFIFIKFRFFK